MQQQQQQQRKSSSRRRGKSRSSSLDDSFSATANSPDCPDAVWKKTCDPGSGTVYQGYMLDEKRHGKGLYIDRNNNQYDGDWKEDRCAVTCRSISW